MRIIVIIYISYYFYYYHPRMRHGSAFGRICLCVYVCLCLYVCNALTFESLDLESSLLVCSYTFGISSHIQIYNQIPMSRSSDQGQGHRSKKACLYSLQQKDNLVTYLITLRIYSSFLCFLSCLPYPFSGI